MASDELLVRKKIMLKSLLKDPNYPKDLVEATLEELKDTELELSAIYGMPRGKKSTLLEDIGLEKTEAHTGEDVFLTPTKIKRKKRDLSKVIKSGIDLIDKKIIGFNPEELSIWSGSNGSGKSTILSQIAIEGIEQGFKVAIFSGELQAHRVMDWLTLQCAGKNHSVSTQYANFYTVPEQIRDKINKWLDGKLFIYNNNYGNDVKKVLSKVMECIKANGVNMVIIDNMMSLDVASIGGDKYDRQTSLVIALTELCKQYRVHIHFVAHPRKSLGFLRKNDISGTADITNATDNVFIVHRVNRDFRNATKQDLGFKDDNILYNYSNVIEICKNRDLGIQDEFIGTIYEKESKRFKNSESENKRYGWESDNQGFMKLDDEPLPFD